MSEEAVHGPAASTKTSWVERLAALSGAASVVLAFAGISLAEHGGKGLYPDQSTEGIGVGFARYAGEARVGATLIMASVALSLVFLGPLWSRLQQGAVWLAVIAIAGGIVGAAWALENAMFAIAAAVAGDVGDAQTARTLLVFEWESARLGVAPALAMVGAAAAAGFRHGVFPRWFSWLSLVFTVVLVIALLPIGPAGLLGSVGGLWILIASLVLALGRDSRR